MTSKQILAAHIEAMHFRLTKSRSRMTEAELQRWHGRQHYRLRCNHYHEGANTGPDQRPAGWKTGEGAVART